MQYQIEEHEDIRRSFRIEADTLSEAYDRAAEHAQSRTADESEDEVVDGSHTFDVSVGVFGELEEKD